jgi:hypothetical protein
MLLEQSRLDYKKLVEFYRKYNLVPSGLSNRELEDYFRLLDGRGNLIVEMIDGEIVGFCEHWCINYEQLGRILVHGLIDARDENTQNGDIAFVANVAVHPDYEGKIIFEKMKVRYFMDNFNCKYFCGDSRRKKHHHTYNVYKRSDLINKYLTQEV